MTRLIIRRPFRRPAAWQDMDRLFDDGFARFMRASHPAAFKTDTYRPNALAIDLYETDENVVVKADLPGIDPEQLDISVENSLLTIKSEIEHSAESGDEEAIENGDNGHNYYFRERFYGSFSRSINLPTEVDAGATEASYENGVLTITLPKAEIVKPKRIEVKAS